MSIRRFIAALCFVSAALVPLISGANQNGGAFIFGSQASAAGSGGPIVLDGMDPVCHASYGENTDQYIAKVVKSVYDQSSIPGNNGKIAILGISSPTGAGGCSGNWNTLLTTKFLTQFGTLASGAQPQVEFITSQTQLNAFFGVPAPSGSTTTTTPGSSNITSSPPRMLWIPDDWGRSSAINSIFTSNAEKIADFVNSGGGIFSNVNSYGWLTALLPSATFTNGGCNGGPEATADGTSDFGLTNTMVAACWHGYFTGNVGTLKTLVSFPYDSTVTGYNRCTRPFDAACSAAPVVAVSIGGGSVSLPSSFTLSISPSNPSAGTPLTITATAKTISGVPQPGVIVSMTVSSGPDAGQTFTATTDALGIATITVNTSSTGTNVYTATATVNGVVKIVSTTVTWSPAPTTTEGSTTTTEQSTTTIAPTTTLGISPTTTLEQVLPQTSVSPTTNQDPPASTTVESIVPTTIHDHSSHSHGELPKTGSSSYGYYILSLLFVFVGSVLVITSRRDNEA